MHAVFRAEQYIDTVLQSDRSNTVLQLAVLDRRASCRRGRQLFMLKLSCYAPDMGALSNDRASALCPSLCVGRVVEGARQLRKQGPKVIAR